MVSEEKNRLNVSIYGQSYKLVGRESPEYMRMIAGYVDDSMHRIGRGNPRLDMGKLAVLTAVNIADEYFRLRQKYEELEKKIGKNKRHR